MIHPFQLMTKIQGVSEKISICKKDIFLKIHKGCPKNNCLQEGNSAHKQTFFGDTRYIQIKLNEEN